MALLIVFGFLAGAGTAISPCVLPVLPVALSAGATGGRRRPLGIVAGLAVSFTFATVALVYVITALGLPGDLLRNIAIAVLIGFGLTLLIPPLSARLEAAISGFTGRFGAGSGGRGTGFWSGALVGVSLGLVYAPCAGPILAGVITVSASQSFTVGRLAVALSYGLGSAAVLYLLMIGGRRLTAPLARKGIYLQAAMGAVMIVFGLAMLGQYDLRFQQTLATDLPAFIVNPTESLESSAPATRALADVREGHHTALGAAVIRSQDGEAGTADASGRRRAGPRPGEPSGLPVLGRAPGFTDTEKWFNTPGGRPLTMSGLRGKVVLIDFWTYSCINCLRTLPSLRAWYDTYHRDGFTIVGVHTPEFPFEHDAGNVSRAIRRLGISYPVVQDNDYGTWRAYDNQYWPSEYFVDARGRVRYAYFGEGGYERKEGIIRRLLAESGRRVPSAGTGIQDGSGVHAIAVTGGSITPESYLGSARADRFENGVILPGRTDFGHHPPPPPDGLAYQGRWRITPEDAIAEGGSLDLNFRARRVYLVLGSPGHPRTMRVMLDGRPISPAEAGDDVRGGAVRIGGHRLYDLVDLPAAGRHRLHLEPQPGVTGYAFTFG